MINLNVINYGNSLLEDLQVEAFLDKDAPTARIIIKMNGVLGPVNTGDFTERLMDFFYGDWKEIPIILDLSELLYISSSGIGAMTTLRMQADHKKSPLFLVGMNEKVRKVSDILGFTGFFQLADSIEDVAL